MFHTACVCVFLFDCSESVKIRKKDKTLSNLARSYVYDTELQQALLGLSYSSVWSSDAFSLFFHSFL